MTRDYARAPRGERAHGSVPRNRSEVTTMIGALDIRGVRAMMTLAPTRKSSRPSSSECSCRKLHPGDIVVLDDIGAYQPRTFAASSRRHPQQADRHGRPDPCGSRYVVTEHDLLAVRWARS